MKNTTEVAPAVLAYIAAHFPFAPVPTVPDVRVRRATPTSGIRRLEELVGANFHTPYWAELWGGGLALARHVLDHPETVAGKNVFDIGTGSGLVAIAAARAGAPRVLAADIDPIACAVARQNAAENGVAIEALCVDFADGPPPSVDLVLAGDVFYDAALALRTSAVFERCRRANIPVLVGDPGRAFLPRARLTLLTEYDGPDFGEARGRNSVYAFA